MRILLIEDEPEIAQFLKPNLEASCFAVDVAIDGERGSFMARTNSYDLIILDYNLPKKNGQQVCDEIRQKNIEVPIIMLSVIANTNKKIEMLNSGVDDYLTKPFSYKELLARIRALLRRPKQMEDDNLQVGDLELDNNRSEVRRGGEKIKLTKKEYMLLEYLMRNKSMVLTRGMIMKHVWDMNGDPFSNTIESHINSLRKKILTKNSAKLIHTISGRGYKIDE